MSDPLAAIRDGLVVSAQAPVGSPLRDTAHIAAMAAAAAAGGAVAVRAEGAANVAAVKGTVALPVIGLRKRSLNGSRVWITPTVEDARQIAAAGADVIAVDATLRARGGLSGPAELLAELAAEIAPPILADVDSLESAVAARAAGASAVATTLAGYTGGPTPLDPDLELVGRLASELDCPVIAEGRLGTPAAVAEAFAAGAHAVVVGTAITDPVALTRRFAAATPSAGAGPDHSRGD